jgi:hypothetical protein
MAMSGSGAPIPGTLIIVMRRLMGVFGILAKTKIAVTGCSVEVLGSTSPGFAVRLTASGLGRASGMASSDSAQSFLLPGLSSPLPSSPFALCSSFLFPFLSRAKRVAIFFLKNGLLSF